MGQNFTHIITMAEVIALLLNLKVFYRILLSKKIYIRNNFLTVMVSFSLAFIPFSSIFLKQSSSLNFLSFFLS